MIHKKRRKKPDSAKTTGRDNPNGGPSPAMMRAKNLIRAMEAKYVKLPSEDQRLDMVEFGMAIAQEMKQTPDKVVLSLAKGPWV
jgi:hypothetical protein